MTGCACQSELRGNQTALSFPSGRAAAGDESSIWTVGEGPVFNLVVA